MMSAVAFILIHLVISCFTTTITIASMLPTGLDSTVLNEEQFNAYKATQNGTIGFYGSCKGKKPGACRYPLECFETEESKTFKPRVYQHITGYCSEESKYCLCHSVRAASGCKTSSDCYGFTRCASFVVGNECVSCTALLPKFANYIDDGNGNCGSIKKRQSKNDGNSIILGQHFDKCFSGENYTCTDDNICAEYPIFTTAKHFECDGAGCEIINPMDIFQICKDYKSGNCVCRPLLTRDLGTVCVKSNECPRGEKCMTSKGWHLRFDNRSPSIPVRICISCLVPEIPSNLEPADNGMGKCKTTKSKPSPRIPFQKTDWPSTSESAQADPDPSFELSEDDRQEESGAPFTPISPTFSVSQTDDMELFPVVSTGAEPTEFPQNAEESAAPCIAVSALSEFHRRELVYHSHLQSTVLCDKWKSCATPGHIVVFQDKAMMMQQYCKTVFGGCVRRIMLVNSPRITRQLRVKSMSPELQYTALSARYGSIAEEFILSWLIRYGM